MNTFSRTIAPSLRISYLVLPPALMEEYRRRLGFYSCTVPAIEQITLALFLSEGYFEKHLNRMRKHYGALRGALLGGLRASGAGPHIAVSEEAAGLHILLRLSLIHIWVWMSPPHCCSPVSARCCSTSSPAVRSRPSSARPSPSSAAPRRSLR